MTQECKADYTGWLKYLEQLGYRKVVLCKDCIHFCKARSDDECDTCSILFEMVDCPLGTNENKYCAWAERKTE